MRRSRRGKTPDADLAGDGLKPKNKKAIQKSTDSDVSAGKAKVGFADAKNKIREGIENEK
nr:hypothetical protein CKG001_26910 [Bdellovibrio sp. CKG001]